jgi:hypothetical protein
MQENRIKLSPRKKAQMSFNDKKQYYCSIIRKKKSVIPRYDTGIL